jgi:hypothetical protein
MVSPNQKKTKRGTGGLGNMRNKSMFCTLGAPLPPPSRVPLSTLLVVAGNIIRKICLVYAEQPREWKILKKCSEKNKHL